MRLTLNTIEYEGRKLYQVARLNMKTYKEELGGYVESRANLPTDMENSWIAPGAKVLGSTRLCGRVVIRDNAIVENCLLSGIIVIGHGAVLDGCEIHNDGPANAALFIERVRLLSVDVLRVLVLIKKNCLLKQALNINKNMEWI